MTDTKALELVCKQIVRNDSQNCLLVCGLSGDIIGCKNTEKECSEKQMSYFRKRARRVKK